MSRIKRHKVKKSMVRAVPKKKKLSLGLIMTIAMGVLMVASVFGIMFSGYNSGKEKQTYGDYTFKKTALGWKTEVNNMDIEFLYLPQDVESLNISSEVTRKILQSKVLYITFNPNTKNVQQFELMRYEFGNALVQIFNAYAMPAISEESDVYVQSIVTCENATAKMPVINLVEANSTSAMIDGECILLEANANSVLALHDRLLYGMLGIIE